MKFRRFVIVANAVAVAACGKVAPLEPRPGQPLPVKPLMASRTPTPEQLLTPPPYARPDRVDELVRRSAPRKKDRFDLPPPDGVAAPPIVEEEESSSNQAGPGTPQ